MLGHREYVTQGVEVTWIYPIQNLGIHAGYATMTCY